MCDFNLRVSWRSYNCSVNVTYTYHRGNQKETVLKNCLSNGELIIIVFRFTIVIFNRSGCSEFFLIHPRYCFNCTFSHIFCYYYTKWSISIKFIQ